MSTAPKEAGAPPGSRISIYLPQEVIVALDKKAWDERRSRSEIIREILQAKLKAKAAKP